MKKTILTLICIFFIASNFANAQCSMDTISGVGWPGPGWEAQPTNTVNLPHGTVGSAYSACLNFWVPSQMTYQVFTASIDSATLQAIALPPGFTYTTSTGSNVFHGNTQGWIHFNCASLTVADTGTYPLTIGFVLNLYISSLSQYAVTPAIDTFLTGYKIIIADTGASGIPVLDPMKFEVSQNLPNPVFSGNTEIDYSTPVNGKMSLAVYNMLGQTVITRNLNAKQGMNQIYINSKELAPGIYMYSLNNGSQTITKRMVVGSR